MSKLDPAVLELLKLDPATTSVSAQSGGCSAASAAKIVAKAGKDDGSGGDGEEEKRYFMKSASGKDAETMFAGMEHQI